MFPPANRIPASGLGERWASGWDWCARHFEHPCVQAKQTITQIQIATVLSVVASGHFISPPRTSAPARHPKSQFSIKVGTIFEDSAISLDKWLLAMWMLANCKNGVSSYEIHRAIGVTQKTAWFMLQRIRLAMQGENAGTLSGEVEVDETYIGGKARNMHKDRKARMLSGKGGGTVGKTGVQGMLERGGKVRVQVIDNAQWSTLVPNIRDTVEPGSHLFTDEATAYFGLSAEYAHDVINHAEAYAIGQVHTNGLENYWSLLKRGLSGTYISVEPFHLFRYMDEQAFRFNNRKGMNDGDRLNVLVTHIVGKRLTFAEVTGKVGQKPEAN
jgi:transposase-like protein